MHRMLSAVVAAAAALTLAACGPELQSDSPDGLKGNKSRSGSTSAPTYALRTTDEHVAGVEPTWKTAYPIMSTYDVFFATEITGSLSGHHTETVFVFTPSGAAYQRYDVAFATDVPAGSGEQQAERTATGWRVWVSMPVAGTMIQTSGLTGTWTGEVLIDSASTPNARTAFDLY
ncbi:MAG: hypothetical protein HYZ28_12260 [Myxococcales bacterium]|nr:hypothetical protein [Myxococcales bacterium]